MRRKLALILAAVMILALLAACGEKSNDGEVAVQSVAMIAGIGSVGIYDKYAGVVVSQNETEVNKAEDKTILEVLVKAGDNVTAGQTLFTYDMDAYELDLEMAKLELEQMNNTVDSLKSQISELENERSKASSSSQLSYTIQIQSLEADLRENEYKITVKEKDIARIESAMNDADVKSPITGRIQAINESGYDNYGNPLPYITIVEEGAYRVKGTVNEASMYVLVEGLPVLIRSRVDESITWTGVISKIDWDNAIKNQGYGMYYDMGDSDEMTTSSKYPFYVELSAYDGLMLGQHVYIEPDYGQTSDRTGIYIPSYFINDADSSSPWVWVSNSRDKLEKRDVTLGIYDTNLETYEVVSGLTASDYIAFPSEDLKAGMSVTKYDTEYFVQPDTNVDYGEDFGFVDGDQPDFEDFGDMDFAEGYGEEDSFQEFDGTGDNVVIYDEDDTFGVEDTAEPRG